MYFRFSSLVVISLAAFALANEKPTAVDTGVIQDENIQCNYITGQFCIKLENETYTYGVNGVQRRCKQVDGDKGKDLCLFYEYDNTTAFCPGQMNNYVNVSFTEPRSTFVDYGLARGSWLSVLSTNASQRYDNTTTFNRTDTLIVDCLNK